MIKRRNVLIGGGAVVLAGAAAAAYTMRQMGSMDSYNAAMLELRRPLPQTPAASDLIRLATLAANSHNTQAWRFRSGGNRIDILPDLARATPVVDPDNHHLFVSLGCAAENLSIAAASHGMPGETIFNASTNDISFTYSTGEVADVALSDAITNRQSTRGLYDGSKLTSAELDVLQAAAQVSGVALILITDADKMRRMADIIAKANTRQLSDSSFMAELKLWMRFNPHQAMAHGDGLFSAATGNPALPEWLGPTMVDWVLKAESDNLKNTNNIMSSAGIAVFTGEQNNPEHWVQTGRACQRFSLQATAMGLKHAYLNQPVEVPNLREDLAALLGISGRKPDIIMRFGRAAAMPFSARRPVEAVMV